VFYKIFTTNSNYFLTGHLPAGLHTKHDLCSPRRKDKALHVIYVIASPHRSISNLVSWRQPSVIFLCSGYTV